MKTQPQGFQPLNQESLGRYIESLSDFTNQPQEVLVTVIVVAYNTNWELIACLDSLKAQTSPNFETIIVDNGKNEAVRERLADYSIRHIQLKGNYKPSLARNVGIMHAKGKLICFLDDDALAHPDFVSQHLRAHESRHILGVRGKILPKNYTLYNGLAYHYDLGEEVIPSYIDVEGNASFQRDVLIAVGGFDSQTFAGEGVELSYRIVKQFGARNDLIYWPKAIIYHNFSTTTTKYLQKTVRGAEMYVSLENQNPDLWKFIENYHPLPIGSVAQPKSIPDRLHLAALRRLSPLINTCGVKWYRWKSRDHHS